MDIQGGSLFTDVTQLFRDASQEIGVNEILTSKGFGLGEAMSAIEIGDPRMDSGFARPEDDLKAPFDPLMPLLPEEVCWILDRALACEMQWHAGNGLVQTVHTCLYVHSLSSINPDFIDHDAFWQTHDAQHPLQLITVVLRAGILGMVKCCDLAYQELSRGNVHDGEDWLGDKADVSLYEAVQSEIVVKILEDAETWLRIHTKLPFQRALLNRIVLRKSLLRLFLLELPKGTSFIDPLVSEARRQLLAIQRQVIRTSENSAALEAFDPRISRHLHSIIPLKPINLAPQEDIWLSVNGLLDGWEQISKLTSCESLITWLTTSEVSGSSPHLVRSRMSFLRSTSQTLFSKGSTIFDRLPYIWLVDRFFLEITHTQLSRLNQMFDLRWTGVVIHDFDYFQRSLAKHLLQQTWASFHNRPRYRRHLMKKNVEWHILYENAIKLSSKIIPKDDAEKYAIQMMPLAILHWRVRNIRTIMTSGFELDLYATDEKPFAYWYLAQLFAIHEGILSQLLPSIPPTSPAGSYLTAQKAESAVLRQLCMACFLIICRPSKFDADRRWTNFSVRYKWSTSERRVPWDATDPTDFLAPNFDAYLKEEDEIISGNRADDLAKLHILHDRAAEALHDLQDDKIEIDPSLLLCREEYKSQFVASLARFCGNLGSLISSGNSEGDSASVNPTIKWTNELFPILSLS